jgi:hypothetical protein
MPPQLKARHSMQISYSSLRADWWRCSIYQMIHRGREQATYVGLFILATLVAYLGFHFAPPVALLAGVGFVAAFFVLVLFTLNSAIENRLAGSDRSPECTTTLTDEGIYDQASGRNMFIAWANVIEVKEAADDIYVSGRGFGGFFIPRTAWVNRMDAKQFVNQAHESWRRAKAMPKSATAQIDPFPNAPATFKTGSVVSLEPVVPGAVEPQFKAKPNVLGGLIAPRATGLGIAPWRIGLFIVIGAGLTGFGCYQWATGSALSAKYHRAPGCTATADPASGLPPCTFAPAVIYDKHIDTDTHGNDTYYVSLLAKDGSDAVSPNFRVDQWLYNSVDLGAKVREKIWMSDVIDIGYAGQWIITQNHPDFKLRTGRDLSIGGAVFLAIGAGLWAWRRNRMRALVPMTPYPTIGTK